MAEATQAAAGLITGGILEEAVQSGYAVDEKTEAAVQQQAQPDPEPEAPVAPADPVDEIVDSLRVQGEDETQDISAEFDQGDEFEVPDFEALADAEILNEEIASAGEEGYEPDWEEDPVDSEARKRAIVAEKKAAFYENLTASRERKKWEAEADKHFPMWRARGDIKATSRRGFLKAAKEANDVVKPFVKAAVKTREEQLEAERVTAKAEAKAEAAEAWGKPTVAQNAPTYDGVDLAAELKQARRDQDLARVLAVKRAMAEQGGEVNE